MYCIQTEDQLIVNPTVIDMSYRRDAKYKYTIRVFVDGLWLDVAGSKNLLTAAHFKGNLESWVKEVARGEAVTPVYYVGCYDLDSI